MSKLPQETTIGDLKVMCSPLPYKMAEDYLPDVALIVARVMQRLVELGMSTDIKGNEDIVKLAPVLGTLAEQLGEGRLKKLVQPLLSTTVVTMTTDDGVGDYHLIKENDRAAVFDEHPEAYFPILFFAGRTTYARFFPGSALRVFAKSQKTRMTAVSS